jgi:hypothetical protein
MWGEGERDLDKAACDEARRVVGRRRVGVYGARVLLNMDGDEEDDRAAGRRRRGHPRGPEPGRARPLYRASTLRQYHCIRNIL